MILNKKLQNMIKSLMLTINKNNLKKIYKKTKKYMLLNGKKEFKLLIKLMSKNF